MAKALSPRQKNRVSRRQEIWPDADKEIWAKADEGWCPLLPRVLPHVAVLANHLAPKGKGDPGLAYLDLWFRTDGDCFVRIGRTDEMAYAAGFTGERAERSWTERMMVLEELGLIRIKSEGYQKIAYVLLLHPIRAVEKLLNERSDIPPLWRTYYEARLKDMRIPPS